MYHRRPGCVVTAPPAQTIAEQNWTMLTLELFPFELGVAGTLDRAIVERETEPRAGRTNVSITQNVQGRVTIAVVRNGCTCVRSTDMQSWLVRIHLEPGQTIANVTTDPRMPDVRYTVSVVDPAPRGVNITKLPFSDGRLPPPLGGNVAQIGIWVPHLFQGRCDAQMSFQLVSM